MADLTRLEMEKRSDAGSNASRRLRNQGRVPAVLYGHGQGTVALTTPRKELEEGLAHAQFFELSVDGKVETAIAREIQYDTYGQEVLHVDFVRTDLDEKVDVQVALEMRGIPKGASAGGVLQTLENDITLRVAPRHMPDLITLSVAGLDVGDSILAGDVKIPEQAELVDDPEKVLCTVTAKTAAAEEEAAEAAEGEGEAEPEVVGKKADDESDG